MRPHRVYALDTDNLSHYNKLVGFRIEMVVPDMMHVFHLGVGQDLGASAVVKIAQLGLLPPAADVDSALTLLTLECRAWARAHNLQPPSRPFVYQQPLHARPVPCQTLRVPDCRDVRPHVQ
jgi:hypothetical protein